MSKGGCCVTSVLGETLPNAAVTGFIWPQEARTREQPLKPDISIGSKGFFALTVRLHRKILLSICLAAAARKAMVSLHSYRLCGSGR